MHGLVARTLQCFVQDTYGPERWRSVADAAQLDLPEFEAMLDYEAQIVGRVLTQAEIELGKPRAAMLEDIGTYLMTHPNNERLRRLMRYGGEDFIDFLHSLEELPGRARLAVPDLDLPPLELTETAARRFTLVCKCSGPTRRGYSHVLAGVLRAMADDYGALIVLDLEAGPGEDEMIEIAVVEPSYSAGRSFELGAHGAGRDG
ncbi:heme NO-binding domain-containing protein [Salipiger mangrovisoli]|uniref:Heme NO-binding domain-containing protein n=1 Tax=Salipiger mangrovisoli TaxID=2865933 RepID=A0ABR9X939_9RHOB|nr:heme NO-binding domain-containing protein [Salipiger mangrovisoli]MBE9639941.1 heme NO-binding domain-containing protein [Salipiger mangrovisoli]